jgi:DNA replication licensing factor MCM3
LSNYILKNPIEAIKMFEDSLNQTMKNFQEQNTGGNPEKLAQNQDNVFPKKVQVFYVNFEGNIGRNYVTPRGLKATLVNKFV